MLHIVINPTAGKGLAGQMQPEVARALENMNIPHRFYFTPDRQAATAIVQKLTHQIDKAIDLVAMGGDGTLSEVLNGICDPSKVRLGLIPCGSGNDFATMVGIPKDIDGAIRTLTQCTPKFTDYLQCGALRGINAIGTGIDVDILRRRGRMKYLKGSLGYLVALIESALCFKGCAFTEMDGDRAIPHRAFIACVGNGKRLGGGITLCPEASIDDGLMDLVIVDNLKMHQLPMAFIKLMSGKILTHPHTRFRRSDRVKIIPDAPMPIQIDGEIYEDVPFDVKIISGQLRIYRP